MNTEKKIGRDCKKFEPLLDEYLRGRVPSSVAESVDSHVESCANCREVLSDLHISARLVSGAFEPAADPGSGFARMVMARINTAEDWIQQQVSFWRPIEALSLRIVFSAALVLIFLFAYGLQVRNAPVAPQSSEAPSIFVSQSEAFQTASFSPSPSNDNEVLMAIAERHHEQH